MTYFDAVLLNGARFVVVLGIFTALVALALKSVFAIARATGVIGLFLQFLMKEAAKQDRSVLGFLVWGKKDAA